MSRFINFIKKTSVALAISGSFLFGDIPFDDYVGGNWLFTLADYPSMTVTANHPNQSCGVSTAAMITCQVLQNNSTTRSDFTGLFSQFPLIVSRIDYTTEVTESFDYFSNEVIFITNVIATTVYGTTVEPEDWIFSEEASHILNKFKTISSELEDVYYIIDSEEENTIVTEDEVENVIENDTTDDSESNDSVDEVVDSIEEIITDVEETVEVEITDLTTEEQEEVNDAINESEESLGQKISNNIRNFLTKKSLRDAVFEDIGSDLKKGNVSNTIGMYTENNGNLRTISYDSHGNDWDITSASVLNNAGIKKSNGKVKLFLDSEETELSSFIVLPADNRSKACGYVEVLKLDYDGKDLDSFVSTFQTQRLKVYILEENESPDSVVSNDQDIALDSVGNASGGGGGGCFFTE